ncbi:zeta toxin family protein [Variovorax sp. AFSI2.2]|uniref:zeta toxin family protein n=1 Tax=Variovorax sp. AFSI2.2 TaxID=3384160 RepID=UPI003EB6DB32
MSDPTGKLDPETHRRVFAERVVPRSALPETTPQARPHAIVLAGQPGAGKGNLVKAAQFEFSDNIVPIDPDAQRELHPDFKKLREAHPYTWSGHTHYDASRWAGELRDAAVAGRRNLIVDTTLGNADGAIQTIKGLQAKGYSVEVRVVATHRLESELGVDRRFTESLDQKGYGRHVPGEFHDAAYKALPANLDKVQEQTGARIRIYNREGAQLYDSHTSPLKPGAALEQAREARMADPKITRDTAKDARTQQDFHRRLPDTLERNPKINLETAKNLPPERQAQGVAPRVERVATETAAVDRSVRIEPGAARVALGLKVFGTAALAHDAVTTGQDTKNLLDQNNLTGAQSQVMHFAGRNLGMAGGAMAVGSAAAAAGIETGPGALVAGLAGGFVGAVAGDKIMDVVDRARIYNQRGSDGNDWNLDPSQPAQGWTRLPRPGEFGPQGPPEGAGYRNHLLHAAPRLADELNYKASSTAVELALAHPPAPQDPFRQAPESIGETVRPGIGAGQPWTRDPQSHAWTRQTAEAPTPMTHGMPVQRTVTASPEQGRQLDAAAQRVIADNIVHSPQAIAQRYLDAYAQYGWKQHGPVPAAFTHAAQGHAREEPNATRQQMPTPPQPTSGHLTPQQIERITTHEQRVTRTPGGMSFAEAHKRRDEPEQISQGSLQPVGKLDATHHAKGSPLYRMHQAQEQDLMRGLGIAQAQDRERFRNEPSPQRTLQPSVERTQDRTHRHLLEEAPVQRQPAPPVPAIQTPPPTRGEHAMAPVAQDHANPVRPAPAERRAATPTHAQPMAPSTAADIAAAQAQVAAAQAELAEMREQMARMAGQRGQSGLERRDESDQRQAAQPPAAASRPELRIDHPGHPGYELFQQAREHMRALDARMGRSSDQRTDNMAACLAVQACRSGLERIDGVDIGTSGKDVWMAQGPLGTVWMKVAGVPVESADVSVQQTSQGWAQAQQFVQQQQADKHQEQQEHQRAQQQGNEHLVPSR